MRAFILSAAMIAGLGAVPVAAAADLAACYAEPTHACVVAAMADLYAGLDAEKAAVAAAKAADRPEFPPGWFAMIAAVEGYVVPETAADAAGDGTDPWVDGVITDVLSPFFAHEPDPRRRFESLRILTMDRLRWNDESAVEAIATFYRQQEAAGGMDDSTSSMDFGDEAWSELAQLRLTGFGDPAGAAAAAANIVDPRTARPLQRDIETIRRLAEAGQALSPGMPEFNGWYDPNGIEALYATLTQVEPGTEDWVRWAMTIALIKAQTGEEDEARDLLHQAGDVAATLGENYEDEDDRTLERQKMLNLVARAQGTVLAIDDAKATLRRVFDEYNKGLALAAQAAGRPNANADVEARERLATYRASLITPIEDAAASLRLIEQMADYAEMTGEE